MNRKQLTFEHPFRIFAWTLGALLLLCLVLEGWRYSTRPTLTNETAELHQSLNTASELFYRHQQEFLEQSKKLSYSLQNQLQQEHALQDLYTTVETYPSFWGITLVRENQPILWNGFSMDTLPEDTPPSTDSATVRIEKQNNVLYWLCDMTFSIKDSSGVIPYQLYTTALIEQNNALPMAGSSEFSLIDHISEKLSYPVELSVFNPLQGEGSVYTVLKNSRQDSIGIIYASPDKFNAALEVWNHNTWFWRSIFIIICFITISLLFAIWIDRLPNMKSLFFQLLIIGIGWLVFHIADIPARWIPDLTRTPSKQYLISSYQDLSNYAVDSIFVFLIAFSLNRKANRQIVFIKSKWYPFSIFIATLVGIVNVCAILAVIYKSYTLAVHSQISLLGLQLLPPGRALIFYLSLGLIIYSTGLALISVNRLILRSGRDQQKLIAVATTISFLLGLLLAQLFVPDVIMLNWAFLLSILFFWTVLSIAYLNKVKPEFIANLSTLRIVAIGSFLVSLASITIIYNAYLEQQDDELKQIAQSFSLEKDPFAEELTTTILNQLSGELQNLAPEELNNQIPFIQARLTQTIEQQILPSHQNYSLDIHLIKPSGEPVAGYSTDLNSPDWVNIFDLRQLSAAVEVEQISKSANRPIVQQPAIANKEDYKTFYRGWIPVFGTNEKNPVAWILCSVYRERPDFNKPIRAVIASLTYEDWNEPYQLLDYRNDELQGDTYELQSVTYQGVAAHYPTYSTLREAELEALEQDTLVYYTSRSMQRSYRNLLLKKGNNRVIKVSTVTPDFRNILFSFFRFTFILLFAGVFSTFLARLAKLQVFTLLGKNERFRDRILDNFLLATLIFLTLLVAATHMAIKRQNKNIVEQELFEKLENLAQATERTEEFNEDFILDAPFSLDSLTAPLNVDASFYNEQVVTESTTPQIYQQHILPRSLPFMVYQDLFIEHKTDALDDVTLASQELLIGYRALFSPDNEPVAAVSISTFTQSPKYEQQLLETTSYLIILYFLVFGLFIVGTAFISKQLTRPLQYIQEGLNKISRGHLDTTIPVTSKDEIGSLASAYNEMVHRLKELQEELAEAEREAAWKEMAQQIAHEIKNPLTPMKLNIQHLERQLASNQYELKELKPKIKKITENIIEQIQSLNTIASNFSKFSKPVNVEFEEVSMSEILNSVADFYQYDEKIEIKTDVDANVIAVNGVVDELRQVIINLVKNAYEAMPDGGAIMLRAYKKGDSVFIEVEDNGPGIREEDKSKIFAPNFSTKSSGTGLGLAICKKIIEAHNGSISFASIEGEGTTFVIKLPVKQDPELAIE